MSGTALLRGPQPPQLDGYELERPYPILIDLIPVSTIRPIRLSAHRIVRRPLKAGPVKIHAISAKTGTVGQGTPGQRMIALANTEKTTKRHDRVFDMTGELVDHRMVDGTEVQTRVVVNDGSVDFLR